MVAIRGNALRVPAGCNECVTQYDFDVTHLALHPFGYHDIALRRRS